ncbi:phage terminase large subunit [Vampirovibrio chlorellavorus]|uniref:phage terminase large subunit n=1 Tax=Vampirovibrio chlorellavorus TaxID=758823 RepID=UPI0026F07579|nr:phage terminase large subunit [Vampirovibrio chlorellavorus]
MKTRSELSQLNKISALAYMRSFQEFDFFVQCFFPHHCQFLFSKMHGCFVKDEEDPLRRGRRDVIAAPRGHAKTTFKVLFKAIHAIVYGYEPFILIIGHSAQEAQGKVQNILDELQTNERLIEVFGDLAPPEKHRSRKGFVTKNGIRIMAKSKGQQVRGLIHGQHRPSLILCDDIESLEGTLSPEQRAKTRDWFFKDVMKCGQVDGSTNITVIGTCLHPESLLSELLQSPGWFSQKYQAVVSFTENESLWEQWKACYTDLSNPNRQSEAADFFEANRELMLKGTHVLWPDGESYLQLMKMRIDEGQASFYSEKQNEPLDPERQIFDMKRAKRFRIEEDGVLWLDGSDKRVAWSDFERIVAFHDPALGKKPGQNSEPDFAAIVLVGKDYDGYLYALDCYMEKAAPAIQIEKALSLHGKWGFDTLYLEDNNFQQLLKPLYTQAIEQSGLTDIRVVGVHQHQNKYQRISTLEPDISNGYLLFADSIHPRLIDQMALFPTSYDDGPDALQGAVSQLRRASHLPRFRSM